MKILKFTEFKFSTINEDEFPALPDLGSMGEPTNPNDPVNAGQSKKFSFIFISADKEWAAEYPTGGGIKKYKHYELAESELDKWIEEKGLTAKSEEIKSALTGESEMPKDLYYKFKAGLRDGSLKYKEHGELDVEYDIDMVPYTDSLNVTFLKPQMTDEEKAKEEKDKEKAGEAPMDSAEFQNQGFSNDPNFN